MKRLSAAAIVPSAGYGRRLGLKAKKPFVLLGGRPLVTYALKALNDSGSIDAIFIACEKSCIGKFKKLVKKFKFDKVAGIVAGGDTRTGSVRNCLEEVGRSFDIVLVHDAARPFIDKKTIELSIRAAAKHGGAVVAVPENDTVKLVDDNSCILATLPRKKIYRAQTPQVFRTALIKKAYEASCEDGATDDSGLAERLGLRVKIVEGSHRNIKVTTKEDLRIAEALL